MSDIPVDAVPISTHGVQVVAHRSPASIPVAVAPAPRRAGGRPAGSRGVARTPVQADLARLRVGDALAVAVPAAVVVTVLAGPVVGLLPGLGLALLAAAGLAATWCFSLGLSRAYEPRFLYSGAAEPDRVLVAGGLLGVPGLALGWALLPSTAAPAVLGAVVVAVVLTAVSRVLARARRQRANRAGRVTTRVLAVGGEAEVEALVQRVGRDRHHGWEVVATSAPSLDLTGPQPALAWASVDELAACAADARADVVLLCPSATAATAAHVTELQRAVQAGGRAVAFAPPAVEVVGPRLSVESVCGLPVLRMAAPEHGGPRQAVKAVLDRVVAALALLLLLPGLLLVALAVRLDSPGPALFRQVRVGRDGRPFTMWKFRTMHVGAERARQELVALNDGAGPLFKLRRDPRTTRLGRVLRTTSLDELPQLVNVLRGEMSMVGPRPALPEEAARYDSVTRRRLLVRPGLTGLWQVHGRSDLSWAESQRLDVRYVENWSLLFDASIVARTVGVVLYGRGAY